jgi:hypothetical protein
VGGLQGTDGKTVIKTNSHSVGYVGGGRRGDLHGTVEKNPGQKNSKNPLVLDQHITVCSTKMRVHLLLWYNSELYCLHSDLFVLDGAPENDMLLTVHHSVTILNRKEVIKCKVKKEHTVVKETVWQNLKMDCKWYLYCTMG